MNRIELVNYVDVIKRKTTIRKPKILFEAGSKTGEDIVYLARELRVPDEGVFVVEPHKRFYDNICRDYPQ